LKRFLIFLSVVLLLGAGYFTYDKWVKNADVNLWSFVPGNSILVFESNQTLTSLGDIHQTSIWKNLSFLPSIRKIDSDIDLLDSLAGSGNFLNFFRNTPTLMAMNVTSAKTFDFLFIVEIQNLSQQTYISKAQGYFQRNGYTKHTREYEGFTITEMVGPERSFTYIFYKNYFIGSFSAFLVEDAIRTVANRENTGFQAQNPELVKLTKLEKDQGNIYVNETRISTLINVFNQNYLDLDFAKSAFMDLKVTDKTINLTGFTFAGKEDQFLNCFKSGSGGEFDMAEIIPTDASWFYHFSAKDPVAFGQALNSHLAKAAPEATKLQKELLKSEFDPNYTYHLLDEEIALITMESSVTGNLHQLLVLEINDMGEALRYFNAAGERMMTKTGDSLYNEQYGDYEIRKLPVNGYPYALLGNIAKGFDDAYYLQFRNYLVFSNSLSQLKNFTISIENEATWTKSIRINKFLELTNKESNFSLFVNTPRAWGQVILRVKPEWSEFLAEHQFTFRNLEFLAFQFSTVDEKFYTNITIHQPDLPKRSIPERINTLRSITLPDYINSKPWLVTNHNNKLREILLQDTSNVLYLVSNDFSVLWDKAINEPIIGDPIQIDYYKNGKLQYAFATASAVHIIDRTGAYLPEFPKGLPKDQRITNFGIIDYDNTKKYRFALTNGKGDAFLTDKNMKPLGGWDPTSFEKPLMHAPEHRRVDGKDLIITVQEDGKVRLHNRRGDTMKGFPIELKSDLTSKYFIQNANDLKNATITLLTISGELVEINFYGQVIRREQLYKPGANTEFSILEDVTGDNYVILRKTDQTYEILDATGEVQFSKDYFSKTPLIPQYYDLGAGNEFIVFVDQGGTYLYLYNRSGQLMTGRPLTGSQPISVMQYENEYQIYRAVDRNLELISISF